MIMRVVELLIASFLFLVVLMPVRQMLYLHPA